VEFWFKATRDGRFSGLLGDMEQSGLVDFSGIDIED